VLCRLWGKNPERNQTVSTGRGEVSELVASARAVLAELLEEGVDSFDISEPFAGPSVGDSGEQPTRKLDSPPAVRLQAPTLRTKAEPATAPPAAHSPAAEKIDAEELAARWGPTPTLEAVRDALGDCRRCGLCERRTQIVFGDGNPNADLLFVGEGPGEQEDRRGLPFVGKAGELLTNMIEKGLGIPRSEVYICNIVKCRPPKNRDPQPAEVNACRAFLDGQIAAVKPKAIVSLGKPAASLLLGRNVAITRERGTWQTYRDIPLMPTLHPAYLLRQYTNENRRAVWEDLKAAHGRIAGSGAD
jgi:uracil-DNA glycosylase